MEYSHTRARPHTPTRPHAGRTTGTNLRIRTTVQPLASVPGDTHALLINILDRMDKAAIDKLPRSVKLIMTMSSGTEHIDVAAASARGIEVRRTGTEAITEHVADYAVGLTIMGLRDALPQIGVPFPSPGNWNLTWNAAGIHLADATVGVVGLGAIASRYVRKLKAVAPTCKVVYHARTRRSQSEEESLGVTHAGSVRALAAASDILVLLCPLTPDTENLIDADVLAAMRPTAGLLNLARGKVVDHAALHAALEAQRVKYAILDTTAPEPLPADHALWKSPRCFVLPHYATNTVSNRASLVTDVVPHIQNVFHGASAADDDALEALKRRDLAVAHRAVAALGWDMLVWNHISARHRDGCLITNGRQLWSEVRACDLVFSSTNVTADIIHAAVYAARPDVGAIIHLHTPYATAVSCLEQGFVPYTQDGAYFYNRVATYEWDGVSDDASEGPLLEAAVRAVPDCNTLLMHNHGFCCFGKDVRAAFVLAFYFERCCQIQMELLKSGAKVKMPKPDVMAKAAATSYEPAFAPGVCEWDAVVRQWASAVQ